MIFPRETIKVGDCIAVVQKNNNPLKGTYAGDPMFTNYPPIRLDGISWWAHRLSYHLNVEEIPVKPPNLREELILHTCDNGWCINPDHLYLGDQSDNMKDVSERSESWKETRESSLVKAQEVRWK